MSDYTHHTRFYRYGSEADRLIDRVKAYISTRRAADWGFFPIGVILGAILF